MEHRDDALAAAVCWSDSDDEDAQKVAELPAQKDAPALGEATQSRSLSGSGAASSHDTVRIEPTKTLSPVSAALLKRASLLRRVCDAILDRASLPTRRSWTTLKRVQI
jgi:hypothetical protein